MLWIYWRRAPATQEDPRTPLARSSAELAPIASELGPANTTDYHKTAGFAVQRFELGKF
jgi:hypothetical protein